MSDTDLLQRITIDAKICHGKPCVRGLRYPVEMLLELLSSGMTHGEMRLTIPIWNTMTC